MQDHFELFHSMNEPFLGRHNTHSPRQIALKSKKKKFPAELERESNKKEDVLSFQRLFGIFEKGLKSREALMGQLAIINKACDGKDRNVPLQEVA